MFARMTDSRWFNRFIEYWTLPRPEQVLDHVRRGHVQLVQMGNFGPDFYSMATDEGVARSWAGMPEIGVEPNLQRAADLIPQIQEAGAVVVGQLTMTMHFGSHTKRVGLFGQPWQDMWQPGILGEAPFERVDDLLHLDTDGGPEPRHIEGRPHDTYRGCIRNPGWRIVLKRMVDKGLELGLDGFNAIHNYESFCHCTHCAETIRQHLKQSQGLNERHLRALFGTTDIDEIDAPMSPADVDEATQQRYTTVIEHAASLARKDAFDDVFIDHGRAKRPDLWLAQWYHKYGLRVNDERVGLPTERWAAGEDYVWYSQGPHRWGSSLSQGYLADMGLQSRHMHASGGGRPFVVNKYDYRRWRVWAAEATAHGGAALAYHAGPPQPQETDAGLAPEDYYGPVIRAQRFLFDNESLLYPATPWSQVGLVYPRTQERDSQMDCVDAFKRIGEWMEDAKVLFDVLLDEQLLERGGQYKALVFPEIIRLSDQQLDWLRAYVDGGGVVVLTENVGRHDELGAAHGTDPLSAWRSSEDGVTTQAVGGGQVVTIPPAEWLPPTKVIHTLPGDPEMPVFERLPNDPLGKAFVSNLTESLDGLWLRSDAAWFVRVRAWCPDNDDDVIVIHWINYLQDEYAVAETPIPIGPIHGRITLQDDRDVSAVEWRYAEMKQVEELTFEQTGRELTLNIPRLIVHGMCVLRFA